MTLNAQWKSKGSSRVMRWSCAALAAGAFAGCQAQRPDVGTAVVEATGLNNAIVFREHAEDFDAPAAPRASLSPEEAVRVSLMHDPRVQAALARVRIAEADANQARLLPNPIVAIDYRVPAASGSNRVFEATVAADLVSLLQKPGQIAGADKRLRESACDALTVVLDLMDEVQEAYATARSADAEIETTQARVDNLRKLQDVAQKRLDLGEGTRLDVLTLGSQLLLANLDLSDFKLQRFQARVNLARLIGQPKADGEWQLSAWTSPPAASRIPSEKTWVDAALRNRPEICSHVWELRALGDDMSVAALSPLQGAEVGAHAEHDPRWRVGPTLSLPIPIFDFGQAARAKVEAQRIAARHDLSLEQETVIQEVRVAYATYVQTSRTLADAESQLVPLQNQQLQQAQLAYRSGDTDITTFLLANSDAQLTAVKIVELRGKVTVAWAKLQRAAGGAAVVPIMPPTTLPSTIPANPSTSQPATGNSQ